MMEMASFKQQCDPKIHIDNDRVIQRCISIHGIIIRSFPGGKVTKNVLEKCLLKVICTLEHSFAG
jgi:hypothetical protein